MLADFSPVANGSYLIPNLLTSKIFPEFWPCARRERGALSLGLWRERESAHFSGEGRGREGPGKRAGPVWPSGRCSEARRNTQPSIAAAWPSPRRYARQWRHLHLSKWLQTWQTDTLAHASVRSESGQGPPKKLTLTSAERSERRGLQTRGSEKAPINTPENPHQ
jgi:hypothetical protein